MCTNSFQVCDQPSLWPSCQVTSAVFPTAARLNHSCRPNTDYTISQSGKVVFCERNHNDYAHLESLWERENINFIERVLKMLFNLKFLRLNMDIDLGDH